MKKILLPALLIWGWMSTHSVGGEISNYGGSCRVANLIFTVSTPVCVLLRSTSSGVVTFGVNIDTEEIVAPSSARGAQVVVRLRRVQTAVTRSEIALRGVQPAEHIKGRLKYVVRGRVIYKFIDDGGRVVYVSRGLTTYEGNRMLEGSVELLYQYDGVREDFESVDQKILTVLDSIGIR